MDSNDGNDRDQLDHLPALDPQAEYHQSQPIPNTATSAWQLSGGLNVFKEFVGPGKDAMHLLMRTVIKDENKVNDIIACIARYTRRHQWRHMAMLHQKLAATVSIHGRGRNDLLQAATGILSPYVVGMSMGETGKIKEPDQKTYSRDRQEYKGGEITSGDE